jgi:hypothetical protein
MGKGRTIKYCQFTLDGLNEEKAAEFENYLKELRKEAADA